MGRWEVRVPLVRVDEREFENYNVMEQMDSLIVCRKGEGERMGMVLRINIPTLVLIVLLVLAVILLFLLLLTRRRRKKQVDQLKAQLQEVGSERKRLAVAFSREKKERDALSDRMAMERQAITIDPLTGLQSHRALTQWMDNVTATIRKEEKVAILHMDIDDFKRINDELGHTYGDELLLDVAHRLMQVLGEDDFLARSEGDDFIMVTQNVTEIDEYERRIQQIQTAMHYPFLLAGREFEMTLSMGICFAPRDGINTRTLLRNADLAMQQAKREGKDTYCYYSAELEEQSTSTMEQQAKLRTAISEKQLELWREPVMDPATREKVGSRISLWWDHPEEGLLDFSVVLPLAESTGLSLPISEWMLEQVFQMKQKEKAAGNLLPIFLPLYKKPLRENAFLDKVLTMIASYSLPKECFVFEVDEKLVMQDSAGMGERLKIWAKRGLQLSLAHFGAQYGSLSLLRTLPVKVVSLSPEFWHEEIEEGKRLPYLQSFSALISALSLQLMAEQIEEEWQALVLAGLSCYGASGVFYGESTPCPVMTTDGESKGSGKKRRFS